MANVKQRKKLKIREKSMNKKSIIDLVAMKLTKDISKYIIQDYLVGNKEYWKRKFDRVMKELIRKREYQISFKIPRDMMLDFKNCYITIPIIKN